MQVVVVVAYVGQVQDVALDGEVQHPAGSAHHDVGHLRLQRLDVQLHVHACRYVYVYVLVTIHNQLAYGINSLLNW